MRNWCSTRYIDPSSGSRPRLNRTGLPTLTLRVHPTGRSRWLCMRPQFLPTAVPPATLPFDEDCLPRSSVPKSTPTFSSSRSSVDSSASLSPYTRDQKCVASKRIGSWDTSPASALDAMRAGPRHVEDVVRFGVQRPDVSSAVTHATSEPARASALPRPLHDARRVRCDDEGVILRGGALGPTRGCVPGERCDPVHELPLLRGVQRPPQDVGLPRKFLQGAAHDERGVVRGFGDRRRHAGHLATTGVSASREGSARRAGDRPSPRARIWHRGNVPNPIFSRTSDWRD